MPSRYARSNVGDGWDSYRRNYVRENGYSNARSVREEARGGNDDLAVTRRSRTREYYDDRDYDAERRSSRRRDPRENYGEVRSYRRDVQTDGYADDYNYRRSGRGDSARDYGYEDDRSLRRSKSERQPSSRRRYQNEGQDRGQAQNQQQLQRYDSREASKNRQQQQQNNNTPANTQEDRGISRHLDGGVDGWISAAAGAALGAITARHFAGGNEFKKDGKGGESQKNRFQRNWKTIAGAAVGAVAANVAENSFTSYFEDENVEHATTGIEGAGEGIAAFAPDIL